MRRAFARALRNEFTIVEADDGDVAIRVLEQGGVFDAVVTDLEMKRISGDALIAWLAVNRPEIASRAIVMTGGAKDQTRASWLASFDPERVVMKPCDATALVDALQRVLRAR